MMEKFLRSFNNRSFSIKFRSCSLKFPLCKRLQKSSSIIDLWCVSSAILCLRTLALTDTVSTTQRDAGSIEAGAVEKVLL